VTFYMQLQCSPCKPYTASHRHKCLHVRASAKALRPQEAAAARQYQQTSSTAAPKPLCLARVVEVSPGYKGLVAAQQLQPGQAALVLPSYNTMSVPLSSEAVHQWECEWLDPFERAHGPLPAALVDLLMDLTGFTVPCGELLVTDVLCYAGYWFFYQLRCQLCFDLALHYVRISMPFRCTPNAFMVSRFMVCSWYGCLRPGQQPGIGRLGSGPYLVHCLLMVQVWTAPTS
jgi:hypothetical protein